MVERKLILGDCINALKSVPKNSVDLILTDPPFGMTRNEWDVMPDLTQMWETFERVLKPNGTALIFAAGKFMGRLICSNENHFKYSLVWKYEQGSDYLNCNRKPLTIHQEVIVFSGKGAYYKRTPFEIKKPYFEAHSDVHSTNYGRVKERAVTNNPTGERCPVTVFECAKDRGLHPTQKPVKLLKWLIESYCPPGGTVCDPYMGSGSTGEAADEMGMDFIGVEKNPEYYTTVVKRLNG